ncbi:ABC transporter permease [Pedobacter jamesrossensis]|uniref:ABC transporter permease n=1 Tax=Pedobacter jamesrossensis TaxID=1908238 RepID=A0ABV8NIX3_9SPHI
MQNIIKIIAKQTFKSAITNKATLAFTVLLGLSLCLATYVGWQNFKQQNNQRVHYKEVVRAQWLAKPDKHPHRMAHYGYLAFREKHELSFFDFGIESFAGVSIFLEAHKQNTVNFSEAGFSNGMLRFGEISVAMVLQLLVPLLIFFLGYNSISAERETGTLKIILCQNVSWKQLLWGKTLGIISVCLSIFIPIVLLTILLWASLSNWEITADSAIRLLILILSYSIYFFIVSVIAVLVSAFQRSSKSALIILLSCWIFFLIIMPRLTQAIGVKLHPTPSKIEFADAVADDIHKQGDSHNPNDLHYASIKDSLLKVYKVNDVKKLPFNYGGYIMAEGEKITSKIYSNHQKTLNKTFDKQNGITTIAGFLNPYLAVKNISMALTGSDFKTYVDFQEQAENYRYGLAQKMNKLQIDKISNISPGEKGKPHSISRANWSQQPDFNYHFSKVNSVLGNELLPLISQLCWLVAAILLLQYSSNWIKTI